MSLIIGISNSSCCRKSADTGYKIELNITIDLVISDQLCRIDRKHAKGIKLDLII